MLKRLIQNYRIFFDSKMTMWNPSASAKQITFFPSTHDAIVGHNFHDVDDQEVV